MSLTVTVEKRSDASFVISPDGRIDGDTYIHFEEEIKPYLVATTAVLILDMNKVSYISSAGLGVIFNVRKTMEANKGSFILTNLQPQIRKVFEIVKALPDIPIFRSIDEVDQYLDVIQKKEMEKQDNPPE